MGSGSSFKLTSGEQFYIDMQPEDRLLIYLDQPDNQIRYGFNVISVLDGKELELFKLFEFVNGLKDHDLPPSVLSKILKLRFNQVIELDHAEYNAITKSLGHSYVEILPNTYHRKIVVNREDLNEFAFLSFKELMNNFSVEQLLDESSTTKCTKSGKYNLINLTISEEKNYTLKNLIGLYASEDIDKNNKHLYSGDKIRFQKDKLDSVYFGSTSGFYNFFNVLSDSQNFINHR